MMTINSWWSKHEGLHKISLRVVVKKTLSSPRYTYTLLLPYVLFHLCSFLLCEGLLPLMMWKNKAYTYCVPAYYTHSFWIQMAQGWLTELKLQTLEHDRSSRIIISLDMKYPLLISQICQCLFVLLMVLNCLLCLLKYVVIWKAISHLHHGQERRRGALRYSSSLFNFRRDKQFDKIAPSYNT